MIDKEYEELMKRVTFWSTASEEDKQLYIDKYMSAEEKVIGKPAFAMNWQEYKLLNVLCYNNSKGDLKGYDCDKCKNKGYIAILDSGYEVHIECKCMSIRQTLRRMEESGLGNLINIHTFEQYQHTEEWQNVIYNKAKEFLKADKKWFFIGGQVGAGKTMICTAMVGEFLKQGLSVKYMLWNSDSAELKRVVNEKEYSQRIYELKNADVLYIDDFFKTEKGIKPSTADIKLAFEIINYRYLNTLASKDKKFITIVSCELGLKELVDIDEAVSSRIRELASPDYILHIGNDMTKNYRLK